MQRKTMIIERYQRAGTGKYAIRAHDGQNHVDPAMQLRLADSYGMDTARLVLRLQALGFKEGFTHVTYVGNWARWEQMQPKDGLL